MDMENPGLVGLPDAWKIDAVEPVFRGYMRSNLVVEVLQ